MPMAGISALKVGNAFLPVFMENVKCRFAKALLSNPTASASLMLGISGSPLPLSRLAAAQLHRIVLG
jgi:hypothetical protein